MRRASRGRPPCVFALAVPALQLRAAGTTVLNIPDMPVARLLRYLQIGQFAYRARAAEKTLILQKDSLHNCSSSFVVEYIGLTVGLGAA